MQRRNFIISAAAGGLALSFGGFLRRSEALLSDGSFAKWKAAGYGGLFEVATKNTSEKLLLLPKGFEYTVLGRTGEIMSDGRKTPTNHDGMAAFRVGDELRIIRNHEVNNRKPIDNVGIGKANHYDEQAGGGTTTLVINPRTNELKSHFVSLSGTLMNCAGGATPWGSWISCEETTRGATPHTDKDGVPAGGFKRPHGYCFEVRADANTNVPPVPLKAMGRFAHEALAIGRSGIVYLTEDSRPFCGFYRFLPKKAGRLAEGGKLEILTVKDRPKYDARTGQKAGLALPVSWVTIDDPDPQSADVEEQSVFNQGAAKGAAHFTKLEGCLADANGKIYFVSSNGGDAGGGQIWVYEPTTRDEGRLTLLFESRHRELLDMPDNICFHPKSNLLFMCEDGDYTDKGRLPRDNYVRILTPSGKIADFAKNIVPGFETAEFAGATFSPDGRTLFVNLQQAGMTFAIWGDWKNFAG